MPGLAVTPQFMCRPPGFRLILPWVRWLTPPAGIFRPPGCTIAGLVWNNESRGGEPEEENPRRRTRGGEGEKKSQDSTRCFARLLPIERNKNLTSNPQYNTKVLTAQGRPEPALVPVERRSVG